MIGFIGLGRMGSAVVRRLLAHGEQVVVFDTQAAAVNSLVTQGATSASSARDVANRASLVAACLPSPEISLEVAREIAQGTAVEVYAELSTIGRGAMLEIQEILRPTRLQLVDAPVSGGPAAADRGALSIMLAGPTQAADRVAAAASPFTSAVIRIGEQPGQAQLCKLVNNGISFTALLVSCEAISVGVGAGIDAAVLVDVINAGTGRNTATTDKIPRAILPRTFNIGGALGGALKDLDLYLAEARRAGLPDGVIAETRAMWARIADEVGATQDSAAVVRYFESILGVEVGGRGNSAPQTAAQAGSLT